MITTAFLTMILVSCIVYRQMRPKESATTDCRIPTPPAFRNFYRYLVVSSTLAILVCPNWTHPLLLQWHHSLQIGFLGFGIALAGIAVFIWSMSQLAEQYSPCYDAKMPSKIITTGPYSRIRHPVYSANLMLAAGGAIATGSLWTVISFVGLLAFYTYCAPIEEEALAKEFSDYAIYRSRTGRFLPRLGN